MEKIKTSVGILFLILFSAVAVLGWSYYDARINLKSTQEALDLKVRKEKIVDFTKLFIEKVLVVDEEVDFETRLELENAVRDLKDAEVMTQWQKFINSETETDAQKEVKNLLKLLIGKI